MQAVRLAQYHTRAATSRALLRGVSRLVGRCAPAGNPVPARDTYTLKEMIGDAAGAAGSPRHCLRAGQSLQALHRIRPRRRILRWSTALAALTSTCRVRRMAAGAARRLYGARIA